MRLIEDLATDRRRRDQRIDELSPEIKVLPVRRKRLGIVLEGSVRASLNLN
jgi:hypothetical protein